MPTAVPSEWTTVWVGYFPWLQSVGLAACLSR